MPDGSICTKATFVFNEAIIQGKIELFFFLLLKYLQSKTSFYEERRWEKRRRLEKVRGFRAQGLLGNVATQNLSVSGQAALQGRSSS